MLDPKSTGFLNPVEMRFQSGKMGPTELLAIFNNSRGNQETIAMFTKLTKHMSPPILNEMAQRLYDIDAEQNPSLPLRSDNLARSFSHKHFERLLGNDKQKFDDELLLLFKKPELVSITVPLITYNHLKGLLPSLNNLIKCALNVAAKEFAPLQQQLEDINNKIKTDKPDGKELVELMKKQSELIKEIDKIQKNAISDLISFNIIKPYVISQLKDAPMSDLKTALYKKVSLDSTLTTQLHENYKKLQQEAPSVKLEAEKKEEKRDLKLPPAPEGPARHSLRK